MSSILKITTFCLLVTCAAPALAQAQVAEPQSSADAIDTSGDIVVTAQKRSDRAQDVPISLAVLSGDQLTASKVTNVTQLGAQLPNVSLTAPFGEVQPAFVIRGVTMSDYAMSQQSPIAIYVDEVYKGVAAVQALQLFDLQRVEVLRGPQGTLYGKNATGGAVSFYTQTPQFDGTHGYASVGYGNYNRKLAEGAIGAQLSDTVAVRIAGRYEKADGWGKEIEPGVPDTGAKDNYSLRASIRYQPSTDTDIILRGSLGRVRSSGIPEASRNGPEGVNFTGTPAFDRGNLGFYQNAKGNGSVLKSNTESVSLTIKHTLSDGLSLTSISSYDHGRLFNDEDVDNTPFRIINIADLSQVNAYGQDLRLAYDAGPLQLLGGAYYNHEKVRFTERAEFLFLEGVYDPAHPLNSSCAQDEFTGCRYVNDLTQIKDSSAVYANANYHITPTIEVVGGVRFTHDVGRLPKYRSYLGFHDGTTGADLEEGLVTITESPIKRRVDNNVSYKLGVNFKPNRDTLLYASFSTGYRGSSFNGLAVISPAQITAASPEKVYAAEIGEKIQLLGRKLTINSAAFHYIYKNQQTLGSFEQSIIQTLFNAPTATIWGGEFDITAQPVRALRLNVSGGYLDGTYGKGIIGGVQVDGHRLIGAAKWTLNTAATVIPIDDNQYALALNVQGNYTGKRYFDIFQQDATSQPGFWLVNANASLDFKEKGIKVSAWGRNLLGKHYVTTMQDIRGFTNQVFTALGEPRTYGVDVKFTF
ncbi:MULTISPECIES: TonB-dependent receptor [unclassified Sphingomonas]|uniref:TonB-dependent receptor n=1 Tax=Novosphingobium rhizosphaerae TaxID=1551649 RepID=UPI0015CA0CE6